METDKMSVARQVIEETARTDTSVVAALVRGSVARGDAEECSDVDLLFLTDNESKQGTQSHSKRAGQFVDIDYWPPAKWNIDLLKDPYLASVGRDALILHDTHGRVTRVQQQIRKGFMDERWMAERLRPLLEVIRRNEREFIAARTAGDVPGLCRSMIFALWTASDFILVPEHVSPSWVRALQKLRKVAPKEARRIMEIEGSTSLSRKDVEGYLALYDESVASGGLPPQVRMAIGWMTENRLHREAFHTAWTGVGLSVKEAARQAAEQWLTKMGWDAQVLAGKETALRDFILGLRALYARSDA